MKSWALTLLLLLSGFFLQAQQRLRVGVAGLNHDHVYNILGANEKGTVQIIGIAEPDTALVRRFKQRYQLPDSIFFSSLPNMLVHIKPDAVLAYNAVVDHEAVVEACAPKGISVMVEKPLAMTLKQATHMAQLAERYKIQLLTNYETTWYDSNQQLYKMINQQHEIGHIHKMIVHDGHQGPQEIGCSRDFLKWLTDPNKNGAGALVDFGCYGANLMTWLMGGQAPIAVTAVTRHDKPTIYPNVDDDATILLEYPGATGIVEASWNWPFSIKDLEVFGDHGYLHALTGTTIEMRETNTYHSVKVEPATYRDNLVYLADVLNGKIIPDGDPSSLENNLIVVRILDAAKRSAKEGKRIILSN